jgi:hypothetical protein
MPTHFGGGVEYAKITHPMAIGSCTVWRDYQKKSAKNDA